MNQFLFRRIISLNKRLMTIVLSPDINELCHDQISVSFFYLKSYHRDNRIVVDDQYNFVNVYVPNILRSCLQNKRTSSDQQLQWGGGGGGGKRYLCDL